MTMGAALCFVLIGAALLAPELVPTRRARVSTGDPEPRARPGGLVLILASAMLAGAFVLRVQIKAAWSPDA